MKTTKKPNFPKSYLDQVVCSIIKCYNESTKAATGPSTGIEIKLLVLILWPGDHMGTSSAGPGCTGLPGLIDCAIIISMDRYGRCNTKCFHLEKMYELNLAVIQFVIYISVADSICNNCRFI